MGYSTVLVCHIAGGIATVYFLLTAWMTRRPRRQGQAFEVAAFLVAALGLGAFVTFGAQAAVSENGLFAGFPSGHYYLFAALMVLAGAGDLRLIIHERLERTQRTARYLWRMYYAVPVASGSLLLGIVPAFPEFTRESYILFMLALIPLASMIFRFIRPFINRRSGHSVRVRRGDHAMPLFIGKC